MQTTTFITNLSNTRLYQTRYLKIDIGNDIKENGIEEKNISSVIQHSNWENFEITMAQDLPDL